MRKRLRDYDLKVGLLPTGRLNAITDVKGVKVGHFTLKKESGEQEKVLTGVTAIIPHSSNCFLEKVPAASYVINGFGKSTGLVQIEELGTLESPIMLTNTFSIGAVLEGTLKYLLDRNSEIGEKAGTVNIVVGECNDGYLNNIRGLHVRPEHVISAIESAKEIVEEGNVGAGTGMVSFGYKGGIGTSSRIVKTNSIEYTVGALVLTNFGKKEELIILGKNVGRILKEEELIFQEKNEIEIKEAKNKEDETTIGGSGSIIVVIATDAPIDHRQLKRIAKRASFGIAKTGGIAHHGSGDIVIAFSNQIRIPAAKDKLLIKQEIINDNHPIFNQLFQAVVESVEEAILNALFTAETTEGRNGRIIEALPVENILKIL